MNTLTIGLDPDDNLAYHDGRDVTWTGAGWRPFLAAGGLDGVDRVRVVGDHRLLPLLHLLAGQRRRGVLRSFQVCAPTLRLDAPSDEFADRFRAAVDARLAPSVGGWHEVTADEQRVY